MLAGIIRQQPASKEKTRFVWEMTVGPALARVTTVELSGGVLAVYCPDPRWAPELIRARTVILQRLQHLLGADAVTRVTISSADE